MLIVGLDAASDPQKGGYALAVVRAGVVEILRTGLLESPEEPDAIGDIIAPELQRADRALIAIDAPLGWPIPLGESLRDHQAGKVLHGNTENLFRRATDRHVEELVGKRPLAVGADMIAIAAFAALKTLDWLRALTGKEIPLAWEPGFSGIGVIEVYPAATLQALDPRLKKYKGKERDREKWLPVRHEIARKLKGPLPELEEFVDGSADIFDACVCLMAGVDFLQGRALPPNNYTTAEREGWIWVRAPEKRRSRDFTS